ncbi:unnamed protein product [Microthlaspi erraticum]|uniref:Uncharacterized protein n=1 Tax=Microthlaspi erraticum TaxID=1685480 RepID=A0A6D2K4F0_9BRAS|nr:unnamed protein product [Microthlaspi erraticum]
MTTNRTEASSESDDQSKSEQRLSQTRAREAENMAKEAYAEKEHLVKLLFKQASEIFGYKHWLQLLHLEVLYLEIKNNKEDEPPVSIPWSNGKARKPGMRKRRSKVGGWFSFGDESCWCWFAFGMDCWMDANAIFLVERTRQEKKRNLELNVYLEMSL